MRLSDLLGWFKSKNKEEEKASIEDKLKNQDVRIEDKLENQDDKPIKDVLDGYAAKHRQAITSKEKIEYDEAARGFLNLAIENNRKRLEYINYYNEKKEKQPKPF
jgi:hypothetical protein